LQPLVVTATRASVYQHTHKLDGTK